MMRYFSITLFVLSILITSNTHPQSLATAEDYSQRAMARYEKNDLDGAIADFTKVITMNGQNQEFCYYFRGIAQYRKGDLDRAIADLSNAISIKTNPRFYDDRGNLLAKKGDLDGAIADLNKAVEIAPQYAKAYGDRGIVRLMRGEDMQAELDFKKCFELDGKLEAPIKTAADRIRQRAILSHEHEKPADIEIVKFSWAEVPSILLNATPGSVPVPYSNVSPTGLRVLADPRDKGDPGPGVLLDPAVSQPSAPAPSRNTRPLKENRFTVLIKNIGSKTIAAVRWGYFFYPKDPANEVVAYVFLTKTSIAPGKQKSLTDSVNGMGLPASHAKTNTRSTPALFNERVEILRLEYADGSTWQSSEALRETKPPK
jgi:Flp pilus assembly protein TadD